MVELVAFVPGTHESNLRALLTAYLMEEAARLKQEFDFEEYVPTIRLYLAAGFRPCDSYPESEIPVEFHDRWLFMRRDLADTNPAS